MIKALSVLAFFGGVFGFIALGLHYGNRYVDRMLMADRLPTFRPGIFYHEQEKITEVILKDCFTRWCPLARDTGHFVDLGYDDEGELVGVRIWGDVRDGDRPSRSICEGADLLKKLYHPQS